MGHKMGIIGYGGMASGYHHGTTQRADLDIEAVAAYDINPKRLEEAAAKGLKTFDNLDDFLNSKLFDFVLVATANNFHCEMVCKALEAGYHTMSEKPVAMNSAEVEKMIATSKKCGKLFTVHHNRRWDRDFMVAKKVLEAGLIGKPYMIESKIHSGPDSGGSMGGWRAFKDHGGGMFLDWGIHAMDQMLYLIQEPVKSVYATIRNIKTEEVDDYAKVSLTFESGLVAQVEVATFTPVKLPRWFVLGEDGAFIIDDISSPKAHVRHTTDESTWESYQALAYTADGMELRTLESFNPTFENLEAPEENFPQDWAELYKNVINAIDGKEELIVKPEQVLRCYKVMEAAFESSRTGKSVNL